jgi:hypothetical protein
MVQPITIDIIQKNLLSDRLFRERRHPQWTLNYELSRDTVIVNRLTQRQSVNVPYMKKTLKTYLTQTNWPVDNYYENKGNDKQSELYLNEYWNDCADRLRLDILEEVDRKQEWTYGRSFMKLNVIDGWFHMEVIDPQDVLLDRYMNPWDLQSGRRITHVGIYRSLSDCERNPFYDQAAIDRLKVFFATKQGLVIAGQNNLIAADKAKRLLDLGVPDVLMPILGETYVELNELQVKVWDEEKQEDVVMVVVTANGNEILMQKPLREILGINMFSWASWAGDVERTDCWSDGGADSVRQLNLVANARWSQKVENGTLANYGMYFYDATAKENWTPVGYDPAPFGFYPLPGKPKEVLERVDIEEMKDVFGEMDWIEKNIQGVSGASAIESGDDDPNGGGAAQTAQEIQILAAKAKERAQNISKYHKRYWEDIGNLFVAIVMANGKDMQPVKLYKKSAKGKYFKKLLNLKDTYSEEGYKVKVGSKADKESDSLDTIQKMKVAVAEFPQNAPLLKIYKQKLLDWMGLTPEETKEVMSFDDQQAAMMANATPGGPTNPASKPAPMQTQRLPQPANV